MFCCVMQIKLTKQSSRSRKYRIFVPVEYFESVGYVENDVVDVDIVIKSDDSPIESPVRESIEFESSADAEYQAGTGVGGGNAENNNGVIIPYDEIIPIDNVLRVGLKLYYAVNQKIVEHDGKRFEIDIHTGKIKNPTFDEHLSGVKSQNTNSAKFV